MQVALHREYIGLELLYLNLVLRQHVVLNGVDLLLELRLGLFERLRDGLRGVLELVGHVLV